MVGSAAAIFNGSSIFMHNFAYFQGFGEHAAAVASDKGLI